MKATNKFTIEIVKGTKKSRVFIFRQKQVNIGAAYAQNDLILNVAGVAPRHAQIKLNRNDFEIRNVGDNPISIGGGTSLASRKAFKVTSGTQVHLGAAVIRLIHGSAKKISGNEEKKPGPAPADRGRKRVVVSRPGIKRAAGVGGLIAMVLLVLVLAGNCIKKEGKKPGGKQQYSSVPSPAAIALPAKGIYGYTRNNDKNHPDKVIFTFRTNASNVELYYTAGGIDSEQEVSIHLNGRHVGYAPLAEGIWGNEIVVRLPGEALKKGDLNYLVFDNMENPPNYKQWAVRNIHIQNLDENLCNLDKAAQLVELGREMYDQKNISKGNLYLAYRYYRDAVSSMRDCGPTEDLYRQADVRREQTAKELDALYRDLKFAFHKAYKMKNFDQCVSILRNIVLYFPDPSDKRHKEAAKILEQYNQQ